MPYTINSSTRFETPGCTPTYTLAAQGAQVITFMSIDSATGIITINELDDSNIGVWLIAVTSTLPDGQSAVK